MVKATQKVKNKMSFVFGKIEQDWRQVSFKILQRTDSVFLKFKYNFSKS